MSEWICEAATPIVLTQGQTIKTDSPAMQITGRLDRFSQSGLLWIDGVVHVRKPGVMKPALSAIDLPDYLFIPVAIEGEGSYIIPDLGEREHSVQSAPRAVRMPHDDLLCRFEKPTYSRTFQPVVKLEALDDWYGGRLTASLAPLIADKIGNSIEAPINNGWHIRAAAAQISTYEEPLRAMAYEGLAMQIVTQFLHELCGADARNSSFSAREIRAAKEAREQLLHNLGAPPSTSRLAEIAGMSERRLDSAFRELFGASIFKTLSNARLDHAYQALLQGRVSVKELSFKLGYKHASSFSNAFRARFGVYPSQVRK